MSTYLHAFPTTDPLTKEIGKDYDISFAGVSDGRAITSQEFEYITAKIDRYEYNVDDEGYLSLRRGTDEDLYFILHEVTKLCGPYLVIDDNLHVILFTEQTTLDELKNLDD